jgi:lysozyme family protein
MTTADYEACEARVLAHEGGFTNDPQDPGGPTNFGITIFDARKYWKPAATAADVKAMPISVAKDIYRQKYWAAMRCDELPAGVDDTVFDYGVNSGIARSGKVLRRVVAMPDTDWHVTDEVLGAVKKRDAQLIIISMNDERLKFLESLRTWPTFGKGWGRRVGEVKAFSLQLAAGRSPSPPKQAQPGKGKVPQPSPVGPAAGGGAVIAAGSSLMSWLGTHPAVAAAIIAAICAVAFVVWSKLHERSQIQQEAPTPGLIPVPAQKG